MSIQFNLLPEEDMRDLPRPDNLDYEVNQAIDKYYALSEETRRDKHIVIELPYLTNRSRRRTGGFFEEGIFALYALHFKPLRNGIEVSSGICRTLLIKDNQIEDLLFHNVTGWDYSFRIDAAYLLGDAKFYEFPEIRVPKKVVESSILQKEQHGLTYFACFQENQFSFHELSDRISSKELHRLKRRVALDIYKEIRTRLNMISLLSYQKTLVTTPPYLHPFMK